MAQTSYWAIFIIILISMLTHHSQCHPLPKNDLISGRDFLSLFIDNEAETENFPKRNAKNLRRIFHTYHDNHQKDTVLPIEAIFSEELTGESSTYYHDSSSKTRSNRKKKKEIGGKEEVAPALKVDRETIDLVTTTKVVETSSNTPSQNGESSKRHIQLVTSGSKIIFFEDYSPLESETEQSRVISVRVSSSVGTGQPSVLPQTTEATTTTTTSTTPPPFVEDIAYETGGQLVANSPESDLSFIEDIAHEIGDQLISNSHKSEFSVEEEDSYTKTKEDSMKGESSTVHKIVAAPQREQFTELTYPPLPHQPRSRTQRKQDAIVPYQTIIYHDEPNKDGDDSKLKPISYSSMTAGGDLQTWKDIDTYLRNKTVKPEMETSATSVVNTQYSHSEPAKVYSEPAKFYSEPAKVYSEPSKFYSEPSKVYSEPSKIYSEPAKIYSEPERVYGEPAKVYSEPAKVYSEPAKNYGLPAKVYSKPAQVWSQPPTTPVPMEPRRQVIHNLDKLPYDELNAPAEEQHTNHRLLDTIGRFAPKHPDKMPPPLMMAANQPMLMAVTTTTPSPSNATNNPVDDTKVGYVVEGENYRKYRVEEKTPDGFIVGEYGVLSHDDGSLRGVRYTADSNINPRLIHDALVKFLSL